MRAYKPRLHVRAQQIKKVKFSEWEKGREEIEANEIIKKHTETRGKKRKSQHDTSFVSPNLNISVNRPPNICLT